MSHPHFTTVLRAVQQHPGLMSPIMLEYLLRGETIGRMEEKGLLQSPYLGVLSAVAPEEVASCVADVLGLGWIGRAAGFYPSLRLTAAGAAQLRQLDGHPCQEAAPDAAYRAYYRWRRRTALRLRKPAYRIFPNSMLTDLANRRPESLDQLLSIPGLGKRRALRYHRELLAVGQSLQEG